MPRNALQPDVTAIDSALRAADVASANVAEAGFGVLVTVEAGDVRGALRGLKESDADFAFMVDLFGSDTGENVQITYHLRSFARDEDIYVRASYDYDAEFLSVWEIYPAALMPEREVAEMFGLTLREHPNPKRLLTTDGLEPMLLKRVQIRGAEEVRNR
jgi:NADH:ubiquinone oxidoreductase subunit C